MEGTVDLEVVDINLMFCSAHLTRCSVNDHNYSIILYLNSLAFKICIYSAELYSMIAGTVLIFLSHLILFLNDHIPGD